MCNWALKGNKLSAVSMKDSQTIWNHWLGSRFKENIYYLWSTETAEDIIIMHTISNSTPKKKTSI